MRPHTYRTRSGAWASAHHIGTSRVHRPHSAWPLSGRTHPPLDAVGSALHPQSASPSSPLCVHVPLPQPASGGLGSLSATTHPPYCPCTTGSFKSRNPYKPIYFETADYGVSVRAYRFWVYVLNTAAGGDLEVPA
jgi:hypothetical protein